MSTEISGIESETPESPVEENIAVNSAPKDGKRKRGGGALAFFAFLFAAAALAGTAWLWWQSQAATGQEEQRTLAEISRLENSDSKLSLELSQVRDQLKYACLRTIPVLNSDRCNSKCRQTARNWARLSKR